jgi:hypothetical protein
MFEVLDANQQNVIESISNIFGPVIVKPKKGASEQKHCDLVPSMLAKPVVVIVNEDQDPIDRVEVLAFDDCPDDGEEEVMIKAN